jgi:hypothetical protein
MLTTLDVSTTRSTVSVRLADSSTLRVPATAGSTSSFCGSLIPENTNGEAVWNTSSQPPMATSKAPSSRRSASNRVSLPGDDAAMRFRWPTLDSSDVSRTVAWTSMPSSSRYLTNHEAMYPLPPVTRTGLDRSMFMGVSEARMSPQNTGVAAP